MRSEPGSLSLPQAGSQRAPLSSLGRLEGTPWGQGLLPTGRRPGSTQNQSPRAGSLLPGDTGITLIFFFFLLFPSRQRMGHQTPIPPRSVATCPACVRGAACFLCAVVGSGEPRARLVAGGAHSITPSTLSLLTPQQSLQEPRPQTHQARPSLTAFPLTLPDRSFLGCSHDTPLPHSVLLKYHLRELPTANLQIAPCSKPCAAGYFYFSLLRFWSRASQGLRETL